MLTIAEVNEALERPISREDLEQRSMHYVDGHKSKADNPHWHRMGTYKQMPSGRSGTVLALVKVSPYVAAWLKTFDDAAPSDDDAAVAARLAALPAPEWLASVKAYRTHAQRMAEFYKALDKANAGTRLEWRPICEIRAMWLKESTDWRDEKAREKSNAAARKRGDIVHTASGATSNA